MRIVSFVGTRPEIIKSLAFARAAPGFPGLEFRLLHTGQNFGPEMADGFWRELGIPLERANRAIDRSSPGAAAKSLIDFIAAGIDELKPDVVLSNTDTDTAFFAAWTAARRGVPVAHIEGGIRCEARDNPEEINRRLADQLSRWIFTISEEDSRDLLAEGFPPERVLMRGDITRDALELVLAEQGVKVERGDYDLLTVHRQENTGSPERLAAILEGVARAGRRTLFPVHPRTREALDRPGPREALRRAANISVLPPQGYVPMTRLAAGCRKIISDSGGLRREGYLLGKPVISLVWFVWFRRMNALGFERIADADPERIADAIETFDPPGPRPPIFGDGRAASAILRELAAR